MSCACANGLHRGQSYDGPMSRQLESLVVRCSLQNCGDVVGRLRRLKYQANVGFGQARCAVRSLTTFSSDTKCCV